MATCDVCNATTSPEEGTVYSADEFRRLVAKGFTPDLATMSILPGLTGLSQQQWLAAWKQGLVAQSTTAWLLCPACAARAAKYMPKKAGTGLAGQKVSEPITPQMIAPAISPRAPGPSAPAASPSSETVPLRFTSADWVSAGGMLVAALLYELTQAFLGIVIWRNISDPLRFGAHVALALSAWLMIALLVWRQAKGREPSTALKAAVTVIALIAGLAALLLMLRPEALPVGALALVGALIMVAGGVLGWLTARKQTLADWLLFGGTALAWSAPDLVYTFRLAAGRLYLALVASRLSPVELEQLQAELMWNAPVWQRLAPLFLSPLIWVGLIATTYFALGGSRRRRAAGWRMGLGAIVLAMAAYVLIVRFYHPALALLIGAGALASLIGAAMTLRGVEKGAVSTGARAGTAVTSADVSASVAPGATTTPAPALKERMRSELRSWGVGLIILGVVHFALSSVLDPVWGLVILALGVLNLALTHRGMFIVNGLALILVGVLNILGTLAGGFSPWAFFGLLQIGWGLQEFAKFNKYKLPPEIETAKPAAPVASQAVTPSPTTVVTEPATQAPLAVEAEAAAPMPSPPAPTLVSAKVEPLLPAAESRPLRAFLICGQTDSETPAYLQAERKVAETIPPPWRPVEHLRLQSFRMPTLPADAQRQRELARNLLYGLGMEGARYETGCLQRDGYSFLTVFVVAEEPTAKAEPTTTVVPRLISSGGKAMPLIPVVEPPVKPVKTPPAPPRPGKVSGWIWGLIGGVVALCLCGTVIGLGAWASRSGISALSALAATPTPTGPHIGDRLAVNDMLSVAVKGHAPLAQAVFVTPDNTEGRWPGSDMAFHAVTVEFNVPSGETQTVTLNLADAMLYDTAGNAWQAKALTHWGNCHNTADLAFFNGIGQDGQSGLDFGVGFTGLDLSMTVTWPEGYLGALHGGNPFALTFLFEVPKATQVRAFKLWAVPEVELSAATAPATLAATPTPLAQEPTMRPDTSAGPKPGHDKLNEKRPLWSPKISSSFSASSR